MHSFNPPTVRVVAHSLKCSLGCDDVLLIIHCAQEYGIKQNMGYDVVFQVDTAFTRGVVVNPLCYVRHRYLVALCKTAQAWLLRV